MGPPLGVPWLVGPMTGWRQVRYSLNGPRHHTGRTAKGKSPVIVPVVVVYQLLKVLQNDSLDYFEDGFTDIVTLT